MFDTLAVSLMVSLDLKRVEISRRHEILKLQGDEKNAAILDYHMAAEEAAMNVKQKLY